MHHVLHSMLLHGGGGAVFVILLLEAAGLPLPGETLMIAAALYAAHNGAPLAPLLAVATAATVLGSLVGYVLGRRFGVGLLERHGARIGLNADRRLLARDLMHRRGPILIVAGRFIAGLRSFAGLIAGANDMGARSFMICNLAGGILWTACYCGGAYMLGQAMQRLAAPVGIAIGAAAAVALAAGFVFVRRNERRLIERANARLGALPLDPAGGTASRPAFHGDRT